MGHRNEKQVIHRVAPIVVAIAMFLLYVSMLPDDYSDANFGTDAGDLLSAVLTKGVAHPSGYPTYLILSSAFQKLPLLSIFFKGALLSAVFSALAVGLLSFIAGKLLIENEEGYGKAIPVMLSVGIAFGISQLFWSQAVIVEVYGLASFFLLCAVFWMILISNGQICKKIDQRISLLSILIGVGFGNHLMIGLLIPAMIYSSYLFLKNGNPIGRLIKYLAMILFSTAIIYFVLPIRAMNLPPINWGNPQTFKGFLWLVSGRLYQGLAFRISTDEVIPRLLFFFSTLRQQFGVVGAFLGILGIGKLLTSKDRMKPILIWMPLAFLLFSLGYTTNDSFVYLIPVFMVFAFYIGYGFLELFNSLKIGGGVPAILFCLGFLLPLLIRFPATWQAVDPRTNQDAETYAQTCLDELPKNAILVTQEDKDTFPIWYHHFGLEERQDIHVVNEQLLVYDWYRETIGHIYSDLNIPDYINTKADLAKENPENTLCLPNSHPDKGFVSCVCYSK